ncbi:hypothetical protein ACOMICROBIO_GDFFDHBD_02541 [Vibrio sp. B1REV9]|nr:hypothetical protein ACOMICROBIO_GDFFDHBD_02541 [Vibrio sp. B1REV9]
MQNNTNTAEAPKGNFWMFFIPSLIGLLLFMAPISYDGDLTIPVAVMAKVIPALLGDTLITVVTAIVAFMAGALFFVKFSSQQRFYVMDS